MQALVIRKPGTLGWCCAQALLSLGLAASLHAAQPSVEVKIPETNPILSEFRDDPKVGRDPFFPNTTRRQVTNDVAQETVRMPMIEKIKVQGISGTQEHPLVILNSRTFGLGEEAEIKVDGRPTRLRVTEIRARSVMVSINGAQAQEVTLGQRF